MLEISCHCSSSNFVYNFNKTPWFPLMWMVRFVTFVHKDLCQGTNPCEQNLQIWSFTSMGTMVFCWSCKQSERERQNKQPTAFSVLIRFWSTHQNWFSPRNGREISSSLFDQTRLGQLYVWWKFHQIGTHLYPTHIRFQLYPILPVPKLFWPWKWASKLKSHFLRGSFSQPTFKSKWVGEPD